jgi:4-hydroxybenzoate polyprenyltransferase
MFDIIIVIVCAFIGWSIGCIIQDIWDNSIDDRASYEDIILDDLD